MDIVQARTPNWILVQQNASKTEKSAAILRQKNSAPFPVSGEH